MGEGYWENLTVGECIERSCMVSDADWMLLWD